MGNCCNCFERSVLLLEWFHELRLIRLSENFVRPGSGSRIPFLERGRTGDIKRKYTPPEAQLTSSQEKLLQLLCSVLFWTWFHERPANTSRKLSAPRDGSRIPFQYLTSSWVAEVSVRLIRERTRDIKKRRKNTPPEAQLTSVKGNCCNCFERSVLLLEWFHELRLIRLSENFVRPGQWFRNSVSSTWTIGAKVSDRLCFGNAQLSVN
ncbi:hypothetical protein CEXT_28561 [Caerostris extrusa]|uniref:Maturase K n=1 Tax=Caerostris extrusa TaxID=172846 RepID=A0AAV4MU19_CAEEX|nr:hypothetical protein CEXT_28561 [Caerostris extrusa]